MIITTLYHGVFSLAFFRVIYGDLAISIEIAVGTKTVSNITKLSGIKHYNGFP
jgi:hypothetical protein